MNQRFALKELSSPVSVDINPESGYLDAFSRLRVSEAQTLFEVQCQYNTESLRMEAGATGAGVVPAHSANTRMVTLQVNSGGAGGTSFMQSFSYIPYQPGKSHFIALTGLIGAPVAGAVKRFGYGDAANGIFYEQNGTAGLQLNRRTSTSGGVVNNTVIQDNWNLDKLNGKGPSGITLDPTKVFILIIDLQYLGMGRVRVGFDIDGHVYYVHEFLHANLITTPYMQTATLPVVAELVAAAALGSAATAFFKCAQVASEAGFDLAIGRDFSAEGTATAASGSRTHILSLQPATTFNGLSNRGLFLPGNIEVLAGLNPVLWELCIGVGFSVAPTYTAVNGNYSFMNAGTGGTYNNLTNGVVIMKGYVGVNTGAGRQASTRELTLSYPITLDRAGAVRALGTLSLLVTGVGGNSDCRASMNWREVR